MYKYLMDPTKTVGVTERTRDAGRTNGQTDISQYEQTHNMTDGQSETNIPPQQLRCAEGIITAASVRGQCVLTHYGLVMPYGKRDLGQHWLR